MSRLTLIVFYGCTIFLSAFLLFQVQPIIGKMILPWFGGSAAVWSTCLLFFQVLLLLGYLYAHWTSSFLSSRSQSLLHITLLAVSIVALPISPDAAWKPTGGEDPTLRIIALMAVTIGLPYFLLSTTGPMLQAWFAREESGTVPYRLFALSNFGSMLGLLSYPIIFEPWLTIPQLSLVWSIAYAGFALICAMLARRGLRLQKSRIDAAIPDTAAQPAPSARRSALWAVLAACPTVLLMAVTSHVTQNVAPVPFLWVLPLGLYLLSFILCFEGGNWYRRAWYLPLFLLWFAVINFDLIKPLAMHGIAGPVALYCAGLFVACMLCHGELARLKPAPRHLTAFYLMVALGGALGGTFVAIVAPRVFNSNYELPISTIAIALVILTVIRREPARPVRMLRNTQTWVKATAVGVALVAGLATVGTARQLAEEKLLARNFYGTLKVTDTYTESGMQRELVHGTILHGSQYLDPERRRWPTTYYGEDSGAGLAILGTRHMARPQRVGVIGLGAGTLAAYGRPGDYYRFYEINPLVLQLARSQFTFLSDSPARVETALGDARLSLEREPPQRFDVLIVDAFSGDSIPVHLLTREAFATYFRHMEPGGILAVHISNKNLDLTPVVKLASDHFGKVARLADSGPDSSRGLSGSLWILVSDRESAFDAEGLQDNVSDVEPKVDIRPWTDDYSSIYAILK